MKYLFSMLINESFNIHLSLSSQIFVNVHIFTKSTDQPKPLSLNFAYAQQQNETNELLVCVINPNGNIMGLA